MKLRTKLLKILRSDSRFFLPNIKFRPQPETALDPNLSTKTAAVWEFDSESAPDEFNDAVTHRLRRQSTQRHADKS